VSRLSIHHSLQPTFSCSRW